MSRNIIRPEDLDSAWIVYNEALLSGDPAILNPATENLKIKIRRMLKHVKDFENEGLNLLNKSPKNMETEILLGLLKRLNTRDAILDIQFISDSFEVHQECNRRLREMDN